MPPAAHRPLSDGLPILSRVSVLEAEPGFLSLGQPVARRAVERAAAAGRLQRTLLVHGPPGAGKGSFVDDLLALLFCGEGGGGQSCNACRSCTDARARRHPDLVIGSPELWRESRGQGGSIVGAARRWLLDTAGAPIAGGLRVILIEGLDRANEGTQNALLKALEEPLPRQIFILVADDIGAVLPTIRSRAQALRIGAVPRPELAAWLVDRERIAADQADALARIADGLAGRAIGYARDPALVTWRRRTQQELLAALGLGRADRFSTVRDLLEQAPSTAASDEPAVVEDEPQRVPGAVQRAAALLVVDAWEALARDMLVSAHGRPHMAPAGELVADLAAAARGVRPAQLLGFLAVLERARDGLRQNAAPRLALEAAMLAWPVAAGDEASGGR